MTNLPASAGHKQEQRKVVSTLPENSETPLESLQGWVTPSRLFFVRNHFPVPEIDLASWRLSVGGRVQAARDWSWEELRELPQRSVFATVECAGNGRSFLAERVAGVQWGAGAIGHAEWTGVSVRTVLEKSGLEADALEVRFDGLDVGTEEDHPQPMPFQRSLPLAKALHPDTLLALAMNGEVLDPSHGFPVRLFVPGWYGVASVKWLRRIEVIDEPFRGYFQSVKYTIKRQSERGLETVVIGPMRPKSEIIRPRRGEALGLGSNRIFGIAWTGEEAVSRVEVSVDGGATWREATLMGMRAPYSWTFWEYIWETATPGAYTLLVRATSARGDVQPTAHDPLHGGYLIHHSRPLTVQVGSAFPSELADPRTLLYDMNAYAEENMRLPLDVEMEFSAGEGI